MSWLTVGGAVRTVHDVTAGQRPSAVAQHAADAECRLLMGPDGPARCYHGGEHPAAGRLHPTGVAQDADGTGYPAAEPAASAERRSPTARPPSPPSLAELQIWRR